MTQTNRPQRFSSTELRDKLSTHPRKEWVNYILMSIRADRREWRNVLESPLPSGKRLWTYLSGRLELETILWGDSELLHEFLTTLVGLESASLNRCDLRRLESEAREFDPDGHYYNDLPHHCDVEGLEHIDKLRLSLVLACRDSIFFCSVDELHGVMRRALESYVSLQMK